MRALDYLETRADVDRERLGVTGLSGGGEGSRFFQVNHVSPTVKMLDRQAPETGERP